MRIEQAIRNIAEVTLLTVLVGLPIKNFDSTSRVWQAANGQKVDCSYGEPLDKNYPFDLIAVFGAGSYVDEHGLPQPSSFQLRRLKAAAAAYANGYAPKMLLLDGGEPNVIDSSIAYLQSEVKTLSKGKLDLAVSAVEVSTNDANTADNAKSLKNYAGTTKVLAITQAFHSQRAEIMACNRGVNSFMLPSEEFASEFYPNDQPSGTPNRLVLYAKEGIETVLLAYDPNGIIPTAVKRLFMPSGENH